MKITRILALLVLLGGISGTSSGQTVCQLSDSDSDGDGWGWENGASCRMPSGGGTGTPTPDPVGSGSDPVTPCFQAATAVIQQMEARTAESPWQVINLMSEALQALYVCADRPL